VRNCSLFALHVFCPYHAYDCCLPPSGENKLHLISMRWWR